MITLHDAIEADFIGITKLNDAEVQQTSAVMRISYD